MTRDRIEEIKARVEAASEGPWEHDIDIWWENVPGEQEKHGHYLIYTKQQADDGDGAFIGTVTRANDLFPESKAKNEQASKDAAFIAHAREDIPWLLTRITELEAEKAALAKDCAGLESDREYNAGLVRELQAENARLREAVRVLGETLKRARPCPDALREDWWTISKYAVTEAIDHPAVKEVLEGKDG